MSWDKSSTRLSQVVNYSVQIQCATTRSQEEIDKFASFTHWLLTSWNQLLCQGFESLTSYMSPTIGIKKYLPAEVRTQGGENYSVECMCKVFQFFYKLLEGQNWWNYICSFYCLYKICPDFYYIIKMVKLLLTLKTLCWFFFLHSKSCYKPS